VEPEQEETHASEYMQLTTGQNHQEMVALGKKANAIGPTGTIEKKLNYPKY